MGRYCSCLYPAIEKIPHHLRQREICKVTEGKPIDNLQAESQKAIFHNQKKSLPLSNSNPKWQAS
jgi:hypothetical protein